MIYNGLVSVGHSSGSITLTTHTKNDATTVETTTMEFTLPISHLILGIEKHLMNILEICDCFTSIISYLQHCIIRLRDEGGFLSSFLTLHYQHVRDLESWPGVADRFDTRLGAASPRF